MPSFRLSPRVGDKKLRSSSNSLHLWSSLMPSIRHMPGFARLGHASYIAASFAFSALPCRASTPERCSDFGVGSQLRSHSLTTASSAKRNWAQTPISRATTRASSKTIAASAYSTGSASRFLSQHCPERRPQGHRPMLLQIQARRLLRQPVGFQVNTGFGVADALQEADALQHFGQFLQAFGTQLGQQVPAAVGVVQGCQPWLAE